MMAEKVIVNLICTLLQISSFTLVVIYVVAGHLAPIPCSSLSNSLVILLKPRSSCPNSLVISSQFLGHLAPSLGHLAPIPWSSCPKPLSSCPWDDQCLGQDDWEFGVKWLGVRWPLGEMICIILCWCYSQVLNCPQRHFYM